MDARKSSSDSVRQSAGSARLRFIDEFIRSEKSGKLTGLLLGQLDAFNRIGSTFGSSESKAFCADYAQQLRMMLPPSTPVIRLSERRFAIVLNIEAMSTLIDVANQLGDEQQPQYMSGPDTFLVDLTLGIAVYPTHAHDAASLFRRAELALSQARAREVPYEIYHPDATQQQAALWKFASDLERAVQKRSLEVYMQPKVRVADGRVVGAEALVRWRRDSGRLVLPSEFIPLAEQSGSVVSITWLVFDQIATAFETWSADIEGFTVAVNVSSQVLDHVEFKERVIELQKQLERSGVGLVLEFTEESLVRNFEMTLKRLSRIRDMGVGLAIDDFGKGYSSLTYLKDIPATEIKIDKKFVGKIAADEKDRHIVRATLDLAHAFGMQVVAEGVDNDSSLRVLGELGCELAQGFYIARPMRSDLLAEWVRCNLGGSTSQMSFPIDSILSAERQ